MFIPKKQKCWRLGAGLVLAGCIFAASPVAATVVLEVDAERSRIAAHVRATGHSFDAVVTEYALEAALDSDSGDVVSARLRFDFADVETGRDKRDREMLDWVDYDSHPVVEFVTTRVEAEGGEIEVFGNLTMHGVEREIEFPATVERTEEGVHVFGAVVLDHRDWELERIRALLFMRVDPELRIEFDLYFLYPD